MTTGGSRQPEDRKPMTPQWKESALTASALLGLVFLCAIIALMIYLVPQ
jgi:hypothetical protein